MDYYSQAKNKLGITSFNQMQEVSFQSIDDQLHTLLLSNTGSGKTLAFLLPICSQIEQRSGTQVLIIAPTRELSLQIQSVLNTLSFGFNVMCCYGGHPINLEKKALRSQPEIVIGTPGRILDHLDRETLTSKNLSHLVLDEFDKTLEMGFHAQMKRIIQHLRTRPQSILTSATKAIQIPDFVPFSPIKTIDFIERNSEEGLSSYIVEAESKDKLDTLHELILDVGNESTFIFVNYRDSVARISDSFSKNSIPHDQFHGGLDQIQRENTLAMVRNESTRILVCTDLAGRGLDIPQVRNIIHYHLPLSEEEFIHRNGRTARMGAKGKVFILKGPEEKLPDYVSKNTNIYHPAPKNELKYPQWITLLINKGKKDKIRKMDIVGFILKQGGLEKDELGLIEVKENYTLAAVKQGRVNQSIKKLNSEKVKGKKAIVSTL